MRVAGSHHDNIVDVWELNSKVSAIDNDLFEKTNLSQSIELVKEHPKLLFLVLLCDVCESIFLLDLIVEQLDVVHD